MAGADQAVARSTAAWAVAARSRMSRAVARGTLSAAAWRRTSSAIQRTIGPQSRDLAKRSQSRSR